MDGRPPNTIVKRHQSSSQTKMVEVTKHQGKEIVATLNILHEVGDRRAAS